MFILWIILQQFWFKGNYRHENVLVLENSSFHHSTVRELGQLGPFCDFNVMFRAYKCIVTVCERRQNKGERVRESCYERWARRCACSLLQKWPHTSQSTSERANRKVPIRLYIWPDGSEVRERIQEKMKTQALKMCEMSWDIVCLCKSCPYCDLTHLSGVRRALQVLCRGCILAFYNL